MLILYLRQSHHILFDIRWLILYNQLKLELVISPTFLPCSKLFFWLNTFLLSARKTHSFCSILPSKYNKVKDQISLPSKKNIDLLTNMIIANVFQVLQEFSPYIFEGNKRYSLVYNISQIAWQAFQGYTAVW